MTFITPQGLYCYEVMLFELKNARATYQRLMTHIFKPFIVQTVKVYIDDIVIKIRTHFEHLHHLEEAFDLMCKYAMKLNPLTYTFRESVGKFVGFMVTQRGIKVNLAQVKVVLDSPAPTNKKEVQRLIGHLATLGRFIAHFIDKLRPFFNTLQGAKTFGRIDECDHAFEAIKWYLA